MRIIYFIFFMLFILSCTKSDEINYSNEFLGFISSYPIGDPTVVIPGYYEDRKEDILTENGKVYAMAFEDYSDNKYENYSLFLIDLVNEKIKLDKTVYEFFRDEIVEETKLFSDYKQYGIKYIETNYLKIIGYSQSGKKEYFGPQKGLSFEQERDLARILFHNQYLIMQGDIDGSYSFFKFSIE